MSAPPDVRAARWLSLLAALYLALAPVKGLVVCHEPDGSTNVEVAFAGERCAGCDDHPTGSRDSRHAPAFSDHRECPCVDAPLTRVDPASTALTAKHGPGAPLVAIAPSPFDPIVRRIGDALARCELPPPRPPPGILHLRSVILVV